MVLVAKVVLSKAVLSKVALSKAVLSKAVLSKVVRLSLLVRGSRCLTIWDGSHGASGTVNLKRNAAGSPLPKANGPRRVCSLVEGQRWWHLRIGNGYEMVGQRKLYDMAGKVKNHRNEKKRNEEEKKVGIGQV